VHVSFKYFVRARDYFVRAAVGWLQGSAHGVLLQEYVGRFPEVLVEEWPGMRGVLLELVAAGLCGSGYSV
jgi:hypothetical protein